MAPYHRFLATFSALLSLTAESVRGDGAHLSGCEVPFAGFTECGDDEEELVVLGHRSPDTDAVSAAIVRAWELRTEGICATPYVNTDPLNRETEFVLDYFDIDVPPTISELASDGTTENPYRKFAVVDTNNVEELPYDAGDASETYLHSIVDHHRLTGTLTSDKPILVDVRTLASVGSILYVRSMNEGRAIPGAGCAINMAGLMLSSILSDTLVFRSSTTTQVDRDNAEALASLAGIDDYVAYGEEMLEAKSNIDGMTAAELVTIDSKLVKADKPEQYGKGEVILRISVFETVLSDQVLDIADEIAFACDVQLVKDQRDYGNAVAVLFFIINIRDNEAIYVPCSDQFGTDLVLNAKFQKANDDDGQLTDPPEYVSEELTTWQNDEGGKAVEVVVLPSVLSRKKQIMPAILESVENTPYSGKGNIAEQIKCLEYIDKKITCHGQVIGTFDEEKWAQVIEAIGTFDEEENESSHDHGDAKVDDADAATIRDIVCEDDDYTTLCSIIETCSSIFDKDDEGTYYTLFAPDNLAFEALNEIIPLDTLSEDTTCEILKFHVSEGEEPIHSDDLVCESGNASLIGMMNDKDARVKCSKGVPYGIKGGGNDEAANFVEVDIIATDGVIHAIDNVLFYPTVMGGSTIGNAVPTLRGVDSP